MCKRLAYFIKEDMQMEMHKKKNSTLVVKEMQIKAPVRVYYTPALEWQKRNKSDILALTTSHCDYGHVSLFQ